MEYLEYGPKTWAGNTREHLAEADRSKPRQLRCLSEDSASNWGMQPPCASCTATTWAISCGLGGSSARGNVFYAELFASVCSAVYTGESRKPHLPRSASFLLTCSVKYLLKCIPDFTLYCVQMKWVKIWVDYATNFTYSDEGEHVKVAKIMGFGGSKDHRFQSECVKLLAFLCRFFDTPLRLLCCPYTRGSRYFI